MPLRISDQDVKLDHLADVIREKGIPVPLTELARDVIRSYLGTDNGVPVFAPGRRYHPGTRLQFNGLVGDVVKIQHGQNSVQGDFKILTLRLGEGENVQVAAEIGQAPTTISPEMVSSKVVDSLFEFQASSLIHHVRQALATDPRFVTLYHQGKEYGCLREFFPPMSPDVLDAALAILLDSLFDQGQIPLQRLTAGREDGMDEGRVFLRPSPLFSRRYLMRALRRDPDWDADLRPIYRDLRALWSRARQRGREWNARRTETALVQPLLTALGWSSVPLSALDPKAGAPDSASTQHILCRDRAACAALYTHRGSMRSAPGLALALMQAVPWSGSLEGYSLSGSRWWQSQERPEQEQVIPSYRIVQALTKHGIAWGILTNGRVWRLFTQRANSVVTEFHEVDLGPLFERLSAGREPTPGDWSLVRQWWMLFRRDAFVARGQGTRFIDELYESSPARQQANVIQLQQRILRDAFPTLAGGFAAYRSRRLGITTEDDESLLLIKRASIALLARILFLFTAEARFMLPTADPEYRPHSLTSLLAWAETCRQEGVPPNEALYTTPRYELLLSLLQRVNTGDGYKGLPQYGPIFFDPEADPAHAFIVEHRLSDAIVAEVLNIIQRGIDYAIFSAYDLGAVCEPLLDVDLRIIDAANGAVELVDAIAEPERFARVRTPDYVATDVVAQILQPILEARGAQFARIMDDVIGLRRKLQRTLGKRERIEVMADLERTSNEACNCFLGVRVVDPAMGTGTFPLSALDVITDGVIEQMQSYHDSHPDVPWRWNPLQRLFDRVRRDVIHNLDRQGLAVDDQILDEVSIMRRILAQHCIYGVDRDPTAVDLSRIGLWLRTFVGGAPLVFFNHRLRVGQGLIGTDLDSLRALAEDCLEVGEVVEGLSMMYSVMDRVNTSALDVRWSMKQFERVEQVMAPYRIYVDLNVKAALGDEEAQILLDRWGPDLLQAFRDEDGLDDETRCALESAMSQAPLFHWPLMFLDAYVDFEHRSWADDPGFDVVIGQVPEISEQALVKIEHLMPSADSRRPEDAHEAFVRVAHRLTAYRDGRTSCVLTRGALGWERDGESLLAHKV